MRQEGFEGQDLPAPQWAKAVIGDLLRKSPPPVIWRGESTWLVRLASMLPFGMFDGMVKKLAALNLVDKAVRHGPRQ